MYRVKVSAMAHRGMLGGYPSLVVTAKFWIWALSFHVVR
jgi:hypothetical protein